MTSIKPSSQQLRSNEILSKLIGGGPATFLYEHCFEILLFALLFHLYGSVFFSDLYFYGTYVRLANTILMYFASINTFFQVASKLSRLKIVFLFVLLGLTLSLAYTDDNDFLKEIREVAVLSFLFFTLYNVASFLLSPNRFDKALISASAVGYLLIIEIAVRCFMTLYLISGHYVLNNIDYSYHTKTFIDTVYFCTVTVTSIGFGDVLPISHNAKMMTSVLGLVGQFYLVVIVSIMVSKFTSNRK